MALQISNYLVKKMFPWRGRGGGGGFRGGGNFQHPRFGGPQGNFDGGMMGFGGYGGPGQGMNQGQGMFGGPRFGNRGRGGPRFNRSNNRENVEVSFQSSQLMF